MTALPIRWLSYLLASEFLVALFLQPQVFAQEAGEKPGAPMPKARPAAIPLLTRLPGTMPQKSTEPERVPDLPALAAKLLEYAEVVGCAGKDCKIFVANFVSPDGNTSKYGMQLADALSKEMASRRSGLQMVDRQLLEDFLTKDRIPAKSVNASVIRAFASQSKAGFAVLGTTTKLEDEQVQLSADLLQLKDGEWDGYSAALDLAAPKQSDAMLPSEPFGLLPPLTLSDNGVLYQAGTNGVSLPSCTYMPGAPYSEEARRFRVHGFIKLEAIVTTDGRLENARILSGLLGGLKEQTIATFKAWRCNPALKDGHLVPTRTSFEVNFRLY